MAITVSKCLIPALSMHPKREIWIPNKDNPLLDDVCIVTRKRRGRRVRFGYRKIGTSSMRMMLSTPIPKAMERMLSSPMQMMPDGPRVPFVWNRFKDK